MSVPTFIGLVVHCGPVEDAGTDGIIELSLGKSANNSKKLLTVMVVNKDEFVKFGRPLLKHTYVYEL